MQFNSRQLEFIKNYADPRSETFANGMQSAIKAGYKEHTARIHACRLLTQDNIKKEIERFRAEIDRKNEVTLEWLDQQLLDLYGNCRKTADLTNAKGVLQLIGQRMAAFADKHINDNVNHDDVSTSERDALSDLAAEYARKRSIKLHEPKKEAVNE
jgi:phage terminase small subunit